MFIKSVKANNQFFNNIFSERNIILIFIFFMLFYLISLWNRLIQIDENWFAEQSFYLANEGVVKLKSMPGILDFDKQMFLYHKLLIFIGAFIIKAVGWNLYYFKISTLISFFLFFYFFYKYFKSNNNTFVLKHIYLSVLLLFLIPVIITHSFLFRPEIFVMMSGFASFYFLDKYIIKNKIKFAIYSGIFAGLAFLFTPNGLIFPVAGFILLVFKKKIKGLLFFGFFSIIICLFFAWDLWQSDNFSKFTWQFSNWPTRKFGSNYLSKENYSFILKKLINLTKEHQLFFWSDRVSAFSAFFFLSFIANFKFLKNKYSNLFIYFIALTISMNILGSHIAERYLIFLIPFMAIIISIGILRINDNKDYVLRISYLFLFFVNILFASKYLYIIIRENENEIKIHTKTLCNISDKSARIFAPWDFIFNGIFEYNIMSYHALEYYQDDLPKKLTTNEAIILLKEKYNVKYLILDNDIIRDEENDYDWFRNIDDKRNYIIKKIYKDKRYIIYEIVE